MTTFFAAMLVLFALLVGFASAEPIGPANPLLSQSQRQHEVRTARWMVAIALVCAFASGFACR